MISAPPRQTPQRRMNRSYHTSGSWITLVGLLAIGTAAAAEPSPSIPTNSQQDECPVHMPAGVCRAATIQKEKPANSVPSQDSTTNKEEDFDEYPPPPQVECHVFMAPSTLGEDTNLGVYTGKPLEPGDKVNYPEIVIPLLFREWGAHPTWTRFGNHDGKLWDRYLWEGHLVDIETYEDVNRQASRSVFVPGVGCTVNSVLDMHNVNSTRGSQLDTSGLVRTRDPGAGAVSPYHESATTVIRPISVGSELLARYGDYWIPELPGVQVTFKDKMRQAEEFLQQDYFPFIQEHERHLKKEVQEALWEFTTNFPVENPVMTNLPRAEHSWKQVWEMYHQQAQQKNDPKNEYNDADDQQHAKYSVVQSFLRQQQIRPLSYLYEHGYCQDHLVPGKSLIPQAGRGAFAARDLPRGAIVGYAPLIHIGVHGRDIWTIEYNNVGGTEGQRRQYDLVINYSFGHPNSTVVLTPYGGMVNYINHNSQAPNVKVRWPQRESVAHKPDWLKKDPYFLRDTIEKIGLSFEYVALRDIQKGEEVVMDYGPEFEAAWQRHVENWQPVPLAPEHQYASDIQDPYLRTIFELGENPYPFNVATMCLPTYTKANTSALNQPGQRTVYKWLPPKLKDPKNIQMRHYCVITERHGPFHEKDNEVGFYTYTVDMKIHPEEDASSWVRVVNMTDQGVALYDLAFTHDWHLPNVFRHPIGIPNNIMPRSWMNGSPQDPF